jgi:hypothetical protein
MSKCFRKTEKRWTVLGYTLARGCSRSSVVAHLGFTGLKTKGPRRPAHARQRMRGRSPRPGRRRGCRRHVGRWGAGKLAVRALPRHGKCAWHGFTTGYSPERHVDDMAVGSSGSVASHGGDGIRWTSTGSDGSWGTGEERGWWWVVQSMMQCTTGRSSPRKVIGGGVSMSLQRGRWCTGHQRWTRGTEVKGGRGEVLWRVVFTQRREMVKGGAARATTGGLKGYHDGERRVGAPVLARRHVAGGVRGPSQRPQVLEGRHRPESSRHR